MIKFLKCLFWGHEWKCFFKQPKDLEITKFSIWNGKCYYRYQCKNCGRKKWSKKSGFYKEFKECFDKKDSEMK